MWFFKNYWILGQNARNLNFINEYNDDYAKNLADSKLKTKEFLWKKWVSVAQTLLIINNHKELDDLDLNSLEVPFVIKPNAWYWGKWILIFEIKDNDWNFITNDCQTFSLKILKEHIRDILDWFYSISWSRDKVIFEQKIILDHSIELLWKYWLPDIRVIVFNWVPIIAMLRVPTANSKWKANLHAGACWVWIDIWSGKLTYITQFKKMIKSIPWLWDIRWIELPYWEDILKLATKVQQITNIGYVGCDIVIDDKVWPLLLEVNVRPWLEVQVANKVALYDRLKKVQNIKISSVEKWVRLARDLFGWDIEEKIKNISGKKVLWNKEYVEIYTSTISNITKVITENSLKTITEIKVNKSNSYINTDFLLHTLNYEESKIKNNTVKLKINILWETRNIKFIVKPLEVSNLILWKEALYGFLVDPFKYKESDLPQDIKNPILKEKNKVILKSYEEQLLKLDKELIDIDKKLNILKIITPKNTEGERLKFIQSSWNYIPQLEYNELNLNLDDLYEKVSKIEITDIPMFWIYSRKKEEIINKLYFLKAFEIQDIKNLNKYSKEIYGDIILENLEYSKKLIFNGIKLHNEKEYLTIEEIKKYINKFNHIYSINVEFKEKHIVSRFLMSGNKLYIKPRSLVWHREIRSIIAHEIEWHYFRKINWMKSKYSIFWSWTAGYLINEEWIATYNQNKFLKKDDKKYYYNTERYYFINYALNNSYVELLQEYKKYYKDDYETIFRYLVRLKRWVKDVSENYVFTKDVIYLNGYMEIKDFIKNGWDLKELYFGKISIKDLEEIKKSDFLELKVDDLKIPFF